MKNKHIYIFRHGETRVSKYGGVYLKRFSAELLPQAREPLERMGHYMKSLPQGKHFVSPMVRCIQTVAIVTKNTKREFIIDTRLQEYGVELPWTFIKRVHEFVREMNDLPDTNIYICTHGIVISTILHILIFKRINILQLLIGAISPVKPAVLIMIHNKNINYISFRKNVLKV